VVAYPSGGLRGEDVAGRDQEEILHGCVVPGRRVRHVDDDLGPIERFGESLAGQDVDARVGRRRERVMACLPQFLHELGSDEAGSADDDDLHRTASLRDHVVASTADMMTGTTVSGRLIRLRCPGLDDGDVGGSDPARVGVTERVRPLTWALWRGALEDLNLWPRSRQGWSPR
jgi:hypothetical protein